MVDTFGALLRELRSAADISMGELARRINYSKSQVSKIENDLAPATPMFARLCDRELGTGGTLSALAAPARRPPTREPPASDGEGWTLELDERGAARIDGVPRRQMLAGAGAALGLALTAPRAPSVDDHTLAVLGSSFDQQRVLGTMVSPHVVLAPIIAHLHTVRALAADNPEPMRTALAAARVAGRRVRRLDEPGGGGRARGAAVDRARGRPTPPDATRTSRASRSSATPRSPSTSTTRVRTVELARRAQDNPAAGPRILGLAARCEAQGHALAGNASGYERALDRAAELLATRDESAGSVLGSTSVPDELAVARGWALYDLGRLRESAEILDRCVVAIPPAAHRARARFGVRRALAHAQNGDIDEACAVTRDVIDDAAQVDSATIRLDLRELSRTLSRWRNNGAVRELHPDLITALHRGSPGAVARVRRERVADVLGLGQAEAAERGERVVPVLCRCRVLAGVVQHRGDAVVGAGLRGPLAGAGGHVECGAVGVQGAARVGLGAGGLAAVEVELGAQVGVDDEVGDPARLLLAAHGVVEAAGEAVGVAEVVQRVGLAGAVAERGRQRAGLGVLGDRLVEPAEALVDAAEVVQRVREPLVVVELAQQRDGGDVLVLGGGQLAAQLADHAEVVEGVGLAGLVADAFVPFERGGVVVRGSASSPRARAVAARTTSVSASPAASPSDCHSGSAFPARVRASASAPDRHRAVASRSSTCARPRVLSPPCAAVSRSTARARCSVSVQSRWWPPV